jgi:ribosomal protein S27AE
MNDEILKKLAAGLDRRSFLRGSSLGIAALLGVAAASPLVVFAQQQDDKKKSDDKKTDDKTDDQDTPKADERPYRSEGKDGKFYDREGVEVRECPECGHNMYQQGRTWTCENCGYSYVE